MVNETKQEGGQNQRYQKVLLSKAHSSWPHKPADPAGSVTLVHELPGKLPADGCRGNPRHAARCSPYDGWATCFAFLAEGMVFHGFPFVGECVSIGFKLS